MSAPWIDIAVLVLGGLLLAALSALFIRLGKFGKTIGLMWRDWSGEPGRPGVDRRPGVMERLHTIETTQAEMKEQIGHVHYELKPNGGYSAKDQLNRLDPAFPPPMVGVASGGG